MGLHDYLCCFVHISHMQIVISVVAHEHNDVFPVTGILVKGIVYGFVHERFGIAHFGYRESAYTHVFLVACCEIESFAGIE